MILSFVTRVSIGSEEWRRAWRRQSRSAGAHAPRGLAARDRPARAHMGDSPARTPTACRCQRSPLPPGSGRVAARLRTVLAQLGEYPPVTNLRPEADHPERCNVTVDLGRVRGALPRVVADIDELARARSVEELEHAQVEPDPEPSVAGVSPSRRSPFPRCKTKGFARTQYRQALYDFAMATRRGRLAPIRPRHLPALTHTSPSG